MAAILKMLAAILNSAMLARSRENSGGICVQILVYSSLGRKQACSEFSRVKAAPGDSGSVRSLGGAQRHARHLVVHGRTNERSQPCLSFEDPKEGAVPLFFSRVKDSSPARCVMNHNHIYTRQRIHTSTPLSLIHI